MHVKEIFNDNLAGGELSCLFWKRQRCHLAKHGICARAARALNAPGDRDDTFSTERPGGRRVGHRVVYRPEDTNLKGSVVAGPPPRRNGFANLLRVYAYWCSHFLFLIFPFSLLLRLSFFFRLFRSSTAISPLLFFSCLSFFLTYNLFAQRPRVKAQTPDYYIFTEAHRIRLNGARKSEYNKYLSRI